MEIDVGERHACGRADGLREEGMSDLQVDPAGHPRLGEANELDNRLRSG